MADPTNDTSVATPDTTPQTDLGGGTGAGGVSAGATPTVPSVVDISDDTMVRIKGQGEPVKFSDLSRRQQADYTRKTQQAENLRRQAVAHQQQNQTERSRLETIAAHLAARQQGNQRSNQTDPFLTDLGGREYIDGKTAVEIVRQLQENGLAPIANAIGQRDKVITQLYNQLTQLTRQVQEMGGRFGQSDFDGKITRWLSDGGYPPEAADLAKEVYLAYEGDDLDNEFPEIFARRWQQIESILENRRQAKVTAARQAPRLPGRGGNGSASKPIGLKGNESARETADMLWDAMQAGSGT